MSVLVVQGDAAQLPLADASVDLIVTSPPYFGLRSYTDGGAHMAQQIGAEATPAEFIAALIACTREWMRVLEPSGSIFVNLGDKYAGAGRSNNKSLMLLPERYRIAAVDELGLIARAVIVWDKPNGLPESVTDRVRRSHEDWVHLTKQPRYYSAVDAIREPHIYGRPNGSAPNSRQNDRFRTAGQTPHGSLSAPNVNPLGKLPGSVWRIATQPLSVPAELGIDHFAAFPMEWPRRIIQGWCPRDVCTMCGEGRRPVSARLDADGKPRIGPSPRHLPGYRNVDRADWQEGVTRAITGWVCACVDDTAPATPGVVLDPFGGTGTTALVADVLGRTGISVDLSHDYSRLARWRTADPKQRERAGRAATQRTTATTHQSTDPVDDPGTDRLFEVPA